MSFFFNGMTFLQHWTKVIKFSINGEKSLAIFNFKRLTKSYFGITTTYFQAKKAFNFFWKDIGIYKNFGKLRNFLVPIYKPYPHLLINLNLDSTLNLLSHLRNSLNAVFSLLLQLWFICLLSTNRQPRNGILFFILLQAH